MNLTRKRTTAIPEEDDDVSVVLALPAPNFPTATSPTGPDPPNMNQESPAPPVQNPRAPPRQRPIRTCRMNNNNNNSTNVTTTVSNPGGGGPHRGQKRKQEASPPVEKVVRIRYTDPNEENLNPPIEIADDNQDQEVKRACKIARNTETTSCEKRGKKETSTSRKGKTTRKTKKSKNEENKKKKDDVVPVVYVDPIVIDVGPIPGDLYKLSRECRAMWNNFFDGVPSCDEDEWWKV